MTGGTHGGWTRGMAGHARCGPSPRPFPLMHKPYPPRQRAAGQPTIPSTRHVPVPAGQSSLGEVPAEASSPKRTDNSLLSPPYSASTRRRTSVVQDRKRACGPWTDSVNWGILFRPGPVHSRHAAQYHRKKQLFMYAASDRDHPSLTPGSLHDSRLFGDAASVSGHGDDRATHRWMSSPSRGDSAAGVRGPIR
jgi:hypothetical protein